MDVIALVDDVEMRVLLTQQRSVAGHAHARRRHAVPRAAGQVIAVRHAAHGPVAGCGSLGAGDALTLHAANPETRPTLAASDLLPCASFPAWTDRRQGTRTHLL